MTQPLDVPLAPRRQPGSALCFVCGTQNPHGLRADFYDDGRTVWTDFTPGEHHQSWPGVLHGGISSAVLDETIARVAFLHDRWVHTARLTVRFVKPAPLGRLLHATGELVRDARLLMEMRGKLVLAETGEVLAEATGTFVPLPPETRDELARQLGGDFAAWEQWLATSRR
jgi:acyl-coenzyme A thioesterase PaaI-like protein